MQRSMHAMATDSSRVAARSFNLTSPQSDRLTLSLGTGPGLSRDSSMRSIRALYAHPTPRDELDEYFSAAAADDDSISHGRIGLGIQRSGSIRRPRVSSIASNTSTGTSPGGLSVLVNMAAQERLFDRQLTPFPTPRKAGSSDSKFSDSSAGREWDLLGSPRGDGQVSPTPSTSSKTNMFFSSSPTESHLPIPPKPLGRVSSLGHGHPDGVKKHDRTTSMPAMPLGKEERSSAPSSNIDLYRSRRRPAHFAEEDVPARIASETFSSPPFSALPARADAFDLSNRSQATVPPPTRRRAGMHTRRESQQFLREQREAPIDSLPFKRGDILVPLKEEKHWPAESALKRWTLGKQLGEGAFSAVWEAEECELPEGVPAKVAAVKVTSRAVCKVNSRTRIAFLREVSVLRHISHPNIVGFLQSFSTTTHHCLVLERITGEELFNSLADDANRRRLLLPGPGDAVGEGLVRRIFGEIVRAVGWLHEVNIVHRDIKLESE